MISWLGAHLVAFGTALRRIARHPLAVLFEVSVLGIALSLPVGLYVGVEAARGLAGQFPSEPEVSIFLKRDAEPGTVERLRKALAQMQDVREVRYVGREEAARHLRQSAGLAEVLDALPQNPLPDAFTLRLDRHDPERLDALREQIAKSPAVEVVQADAGWARKVEAVSRIGRSAALVLGVLLGAAALSVTFNTVRLQMLGQREEIRLSRLIGATSAYIRRPFVYFGALQGWMGGALALAIARAAGAVLAEPIDTFSMAYGVTIASPPASVELIAAFLVGTTLMGAAAAWIAATRHLWASELQRD